MKKILYITTISSTINAFLVPHIQMLRNQGHMVDCACSIDIPIDDSLINDGVRVFDIPFSRNPLHPGNIKAFKKLVKIQKENEYDVVHVHTPVASVYGRLLKLKFKNLMTIYTAHGFHFYKGAPLINWLVYYPIERIMTKFTDTIITMNSEDYDRVKKFNINNTYKVNGVGIDLSKYSINNFNKNEIREKLNLNKEDFIILMVAEVNKSKGINNIKLLCAGDGILFDEIKTYIEQKKLQDKIYMLGYRTDINELMISCDVGALMSYREGLPRNIMEFMACEKTIIGTDIRGIRDLIQDGVNGYLVEIGNSNDTADKIEYIYKNRIEMKNMEKNSREIVSQYEIGKVLDEIKKIYSNCSV